MRTPVALHLAAAMTLLEIAAPALRAQSPEFEVASIKASRADSGSSFSFQNGKVAVTNASLLALVQRAYDLGTSRVVGPSWLDSDRYDVLAKSQPGVSDSDMRPMLQNFLKDRFRLSVHWDKKEMPVYEMVVAKDGLKIKPFDPAHLQQEFKPGRGGMSMIMGVGTMTKLAKSISGSAGRPVIDKTGLEGQYVYQVTFDSLSAQSESASDPAPDFFAAVEQQLGLKLESKRAPVEVLVIDHAERMPIEN
jgi:uncharacterized protein (TIGR03435 family)